MGEINIIERYKLTTRFQQTLLHHAGNNVQIFVSKVPPKWKIEPQDRESIMGEQIIIDCQANG